MRSRLNTNNHIIKCKNIKKTSDMIVQENQLNQQFQDKKPREDLT